MKTAKNKIIFDGQIAQREVDNKGEQIQVIVFKIGQEEYGLLIDQIKEVVLTPNLTQVPEVDNYIKGVANVRGNIIAVIDLEERFRIVKKKTDQIGKYVLVVASEDCKLGVLVKEMPKTLSITRSKIEEYNSVVGGNSSDAKYIKGIIKLEERLILLIDVYSVVDSHELENIV